MRLIWVILAGAVVVALAGGVILTRRLAQVSERPAPAASAPDDGLDVILDEVNWDDVPLEKAMEDLAARTGVAIRVDPQAARRDDGGAWNSVRMNLRSVRARLVLELAIEQATGGWEALRYEAATRTVTRNQASAEYGVYVPRVYDVHDLIEDLIRWHEKYPLDGPAYAQLSVRPSIAGKGSQVPSVSQLAGIRVRDWALGCTPLVWGGLSWLPPNKAVIADGRLLFVATRTEHERVRTVLECIRNVQRGTAPMGAPKRSLPDCLGGEYDWPARDAEHDHARVIATATGMNTVQVGQWGLPFGHPGIHRGSVRAYLREHDLEWKIEENVLVLDDRWNTSMAAGICRAYDISAVIQNHAAEIARFRQMHPLGPCTVLMGPYLVVVGSTLDHEEVEAAIDSVCKTHREESP